MTEELKCQGARRFTVSYTHVEPDKIGISNGWVYCPYNNGKLTAEWIENKTYRRYFDVGYFPIAAIKACGEIYGYACGYYEESSLSLDYQRDGQKWYKPYGSSQSERRVYLRVFTREVVDILFETNNVIDPRISIDWLYSLDGKGELGSSTLWEFAECTPRDRPDHLGGGTYYPLSSFPALSLNEKLTFRANVLSVWNLSVKENGQEIITFGLPRNRHSGTGFPDFVPTLLINYEPSTEEFKTYTFTKRQQDSTIRLELEPWYVWAYSPSDSRRYSGGQRYKLVFAEIDSEGNRIKINYTDVLSGGVPIPGDIKIICEYCPDNTCAVDCGDKICCYGSDGIAVDYYLK